MATKLGERLEELAAFLAHAHAVDSVEETLGHLQTEVADAMTRSRASAQQCTILLFQSAEPPSLLRFLSTSADFADDARKREISAARGGVLELLAAFLKAYGAHRALTKQHVVDLYKACQQTARTDPFNRVKGHALTVVVNVLKFADKRVTSDDIEPRAYVEKLFYDIKFSKATQTAKGQMMEVIGYLVGKFPKEVDENVPTLLSWIENELEKQFSSNSPEMMMVNGLLFALARLLECDVERYKRDGALQKKIYSYLLTVFATTVSGNLSRYQVTNSSETFLARHAQIFQQEIGPNGYLWFSYMKFCCQSENKTIKEHAFTCSNAILQVLNKYLVEAKDDARKKCLNKILKEILPTVSDSAANTSMTAFAVQCLGWLASSIYVYLGAKGYGKIEDKLKTFGESLLALDTKVTAWRWPLFSQYVQCIGQFVQERHGVPLDEGYVKFLGDMLCHVMAAYPQCLWKSKVVVHKSIAAVFAALSNWTVIDPLVDRFVLHTLMLSISNITDSEVIIYHPDTGELVTNLLYEYESFWLAMLGRCTEMAAEPTLVAMKTGSDDVEMKEPSDVGRSLQTIIFDSTVKHVLGIIGQLNLSYQFDLQTTNNGKNATGYLPTVPRDHSIMLNMTEFVERVLGQVLRPLLRPWIPLIMQRVMSSASKLPLVSSFYRIGTVVAIAMDDLKFFDSPPIIDDRLSRFRDDFKTFVQRVCAQARFYQDELLLTCSEFVLTAPIELIAVHTMIGIVRSVLELGRSYLPAAIVAVTALERWQKQCLNDLEDVISEVIPLLSAYLDQEALSDEESSLVKLSGKGMRNTSSNETSDLAQLQRRILLLLGKCGGKISLLMSEPPSLINADGSMGSISSPFFRLELQLSELSISLAMDPILSHLGNLATHSSVRRVKASASEGYHALVCYLCGKTATYPHAAGKKSEFYDTWRGVFARIVRLATDPEKICRSLFEPLLFQLLRWMAANSDTFPFEYSSMLDELTRSLSDSETAVRTMSARCIAVFLSLALENSKAQANADDIFERVFSLCRHPGAVQRSGAAASISYFLRSFKEEDGQILTQFALPCLKNLLYALRLCDNDVRNRIGGVDISRDVISKAVMKIKRGICRFPQLFLKGSTSARDVDEDSVLQRTTLWLFQQTGAREVLFRRLCQQLFMSFSTLISKSSAEWIQKYASTHGSESVVTVLVPMSSLAHTSITVQWMEQLSASIESYVWCVEMLGDKAKDIFENSLTSRQESMKRKHFADVSAQEYSCQQTLSWAIATFLKNGGPWEDSLKGSHWTGAYLSVLTSLCCCVMSFMKTGNVVLRNVADMDTQSFRGAVAEKLLQAILHLPDTQVHDANSLDGIEEFCSGVITRSPDWAQQMQETVDSMLSNLQLCLANVNSSESFVEHSITIGLLSFFGSKVLNAGIISFPVADKYVEMFAMVASKAMEYGHGSPHDRLVAIAALKAAAACGWRITDIFANPADRQVYGPVYSDVIHFMPTLAVWNRCASELVSQSLKNDFVVNVLADILCQVTSFKVYPSKSADWDVFTKTLVANVKQFVSNLEAVKADTQRVLSTLQVLRHFLELCQHCSESLVEALRMGPIPDIQDAIIKLLKQRGCSYLVKAEVLRMLALLGPTSLLVSNEEKASKAMLDALVALVFDEFPIVSVDVARGSKEFDVFYLLFSELLGVIERSNSIAYLKIIYPSLKEADNHLFRTEIKQMLARFSISLGSQTGHATSGERIRHQLVELLDVLLDPTLDIAIRKTLLEEVFTPLVECQTGETLLQFYLMESLTKKSTIISLLATLVSTAAEVSSGGSRIGVFVAFSLVEILYRLIDPEIIRTEINSAFLGHKNGKGREFTMLVCKCASKVVTKTYGDVDDLVRLACCAAYNCLLTAVSRTQKQEKFFDQILFQPALWSNILDLSREYELHAETETFATIPLSSLSAISLEARLDTNATTNAKSKRNESAALRFFTASSLSMDTDSQTASTLTASLDVNQVGSTYENIEIELDTFNQHPCMIPLLRVLVQMKTDFGSSWSEKAMPGWMKKIFDVIVDPSTGLNVRLFVAKVVLNVPNVFAMYSSPWLRAVMEALLDASAAQKAPEFNYILRDCCNLVLNSWKDVAVSSLSDTASRFVNELVKICPELNNLIRNSNVLLITELIALWKDSASVDAGVLITYMINDDDDSKMKSAKQFAALQIVSAMLTTGLESELLVEEGGQTIEDGILLVMTSKTTSLYTLAAEVGGLYLQTAGHSEGEEFMCKVRNLIIGSYNEENFGRFLALLRNASMHQPEIIDSVMLQRLSFVLPKAVAVDAWALLAADSLNNAAGNESVVKDIFTHAQSVLGRFVAHRHAGVQLSTLGAISRLLDHLNLSELERLIANTSEGGIGTLKCYEGHDLSEYRRLLFTVGKKLYEKDLSDQVKSRVRVSLLHGLCDSDDQRRKEAFEYWNTSAAIVNSCSDRLLSIFGSLYSSEFDEKWILYATNLLVGMSKESSEFERPLFTSALGSGEYAETPIDASWEAKTQSMAPLFSVEADLFSARPEFTQQSTSLTYTASQADGSLGSTIQSQLFLSKPASIGASYSQSFGESDVVQQRPGRNRFFKRRAAAVNSAVKDPSSYDKKASKRFFQDQYALLKKKEEAQKTRERKQRQGHVSMKRTYRVGEFPDIQITQQDIVDPIMALCETSIETSSLVFGALFSSIVASPQFEKSGITHELTERLEETLTLSQSSSVYVGCIVSAYFASIVRNPRLCEMLPVRPKTVGEAGLSSGKYHISELTLEEQLLHEIQGKTRDLNLASNELVTNCWDLLHKLLSTMHKRNLLIALSMTCSTTAESKLALQAQLSGDLPLAIASYKKAESILDSQMEILDGDNSFATETDATRCRWQRRNCLETLNNWDTLKNELTDATQTDSDFLWKQRPPYLEQGVGHYLRSCLGLVEAKQTNSDLASLRSFIEGAMRDSAKMELVQSRFPVEMCLTYLSSSDKNQARVCVETFYTNFLKMWRQTSPMASTSRMQLLQSLSSMVEIDEVLSRFGRDYSDIGKMGHQSVTAFMDAWRRSPPSTGEEGMVLWSQHSMVQNTVAGFMLNYARDQRLYSDEIGLAVLGGKSNTMLQYANAAISCNILALASKMLKNYRELCNTHQLPKLSVQMVEVFVSHVLKLVDRQEHQSDKSGSNSSSIKLITRYYETATKMFDNVEIMNMMETAGASDKVAMGYLEAKTFASAAGFYAVNDVDDNLKEEYLSRSLDMFKVSCKRIDAVSRKEMEDGASSAFLRCRLTFIEFLNDLFFKRKMEKLAKLTDRKALTKLLAENVLGGMAAGDRECANYFPQLCDVIVPYPDIVAEFEQCVLTNVPLWTCLQWSAQLMALLNGPIGKTIIAILEKMAEKYPVALFYDFMVTCRSSLDKFKVDLHRLEVLLANTVMEKFVTALRLIHHPELRLKEGLREIAKLIEDNRMSDARRKVEHLWKDCFSPDHPLLGTQIGRYNRDWSRKAKRDVEKIMGKDGSKMTAKTVNTAREWIMNHFGVTPGRYGITKDMKAHLGDFAEWLEEFDHSSCILELPGQYTSYWRPPDPSTHIRILSFDSMLGVLASKQLPKRLTMHCSDEKDYTFLVKGGEDLRLDQRIEQLFGVMNQILEADPRCCDQRLSLTTYDVIPMTQEIGLLEWVGGTTTLKAVIEAQLQIDERCVDLKSNKRQKLELFNTTAAKTYESFLLKQRGASFSAKVVAPRSKDVVDQFAKVQAMIPADLLRRQLLGLGSNFEAFLLVRDQFLKSVAVFSACSYVLGIGDRHLDNFLLDLASGRVIGIDFGVSFGSGASVLPVPELIPFRYTRQMDFVFQPYDGANLLSQEMQAVFDALRSKRQVVESVMNVFLHEPLLDWQQSTTTRQKALFESKGDDQSTLQDSDVEMEDVEEPRKTTSPAGGNETTAWLPDVKIAIARRKLEGVSPALLLKEELAQNPHLKPHLSKFHVLVDTANIGEDGADEMVELSSLTQAQELLAMATAPDLLGRTFQGWMPWL